MNMRAVELDENESFTKQMYSMHQPVQGIVRDHHPLGGQLQRQCL